MTPSRTVGHLVWAWPTLHIPLACSSCCPCPPVTFGENMKHRSRSVARLLTVVILLASWVVTGRAQTQGGITGTVTDSSGAAIPGASVTVTNTATRGTRETTTNADGLYTFPAVPPGSYELRVELQGFKTAEIPTFKVDVQRTVRVDVRLQVGALNETVTVEAK